MIKKTLIKKEIEARDSNNFNLNSETPSIDVPGVYFKDARNMSELPDKSVQLIVSSPPYFIGMEFEKGMTFREHLTNVRDVMKEK